MSANAALHPIVLINSLYTNEVTATIDQFTTYAFAEFLYYDNYFFCLNAGWGTQAIAASVQMAMAFKDCYKNVITTIFNWCNWIGPDALWIDSCDNSNEEAIKFISYNIVPSAYTVSDNYLIGGGVSTDFTQAKNCWPGRLFS